MNIALFSQDGFFFFIRWIHLFAGVIWIGLLYYFNFVQGAFFAETDAATKSNAIQKLVPRALLWFRWAAFFTALSGLIYLGSTQYRAAGVFQTARGVFILTGAILGLIMATNVWFVIWPNQKIVIASAVQAAGGKGPIAEAAAAGAKAALASRTNVLFSMPMLFFMGASGHLMKDVDPSKSQGAYYGALFVLLGLIELNALKGKMGPLTTVRGVIHMGVALTLVMYFMIEFLV